MIGERLKSARSNRGWTLDALASHTGIPTSSLCEFEKGSREPRLSHLEKLSHAFGRPVASFFDSSQTSPDVVLWRECPKNPDESASIEANFLKHCRWYHNLESWCDEHQDSELPKFNEHIGKIDKAYVASMAHRVRRSLDLGKYPAHSLLSTLENICGIRIFHMQFEPTGTAACTQNDEFGMAILLNSSNVRWRRNFDLAHELFHLLTWKTYRVGSSAQRTSTSEESLANSFASCLLIPSDPLHDAMASAIKSGGSLKHIEIFDIARQFDVSFESILWRVHVLYNRKLKDTKHDIEVCRSIREQVDTRDDTRPPELPARYRSLAKRALRDGEMSIGRAAEYLGISRHEAMGLVNQEESVDVPIKISPTRC